MYSIARRLCGVRTISYNNSSSSLLKFLSTSSCRIRPTTTRNRDMSSLSRTSSASATFQQQVGYATDLEGNLEYWDVHINKSTVITRAANNINSGSSSSSSNKSSSRPKLLLRDNCQFVYGGDVCDRGTGDIRILADLIQLKEDYPERVHLILGNRDINKLRLPFALHDSVLAHTPNVWWVPADKDKHDTCALNDRNAKMKWVLAQTMGSPFSFEYRREELAEMGLPHADDDVTQSYLDLLTPDGLLTKYIKYGKIGVIIADTMFIHGGLLSHNFGKVPIVMHQWESGADIARNVHTALEAQTVAKEKALTTLEMEEDGEKGGSGGVMGEELQNFDHFLNATEWIDAVNGFALKDVQDFISKKDSYLQFMTEQHQQWKEKEEEEKENTITVKMPDSPSPVTVVKREDLLWESSSLGYDHPQPGSRLAQYGMGSVPGTKLPNPSVVYASYLAAGKPVKCPEDVSRWLNAAGVTALVVGHQPNGDAPLIIRSTYYDAAPLTAVAADNNKKEEGEGGEQRRSHSSISSSSSSSVDIICVDNAYSRNVLWELPSTVDTASSSVDCGEKEQPLKWITYEAYTAAATAAAAGPTTASARSAGTVPPHAKTRSDLCGCELVITIIEPNITSTPPPPSSGKDCIPTATTPVKASSTSFTSGASDSEDTAAIAPSSTCTGTGTSSAGGSSGSDPRAPQDLSSNDNDYSSATDGAVGATGGGEDFSGSSSYSAATSSSHSHSHSYSHTSTTPTLVYGARDMITLRNSSASPNANINEPPAGYNITTGVSPSRPVTKRSRITVSGSLSNGDQYSYSLRDSPLIGKETTDGWFLKAVGVQRTSTGTDKSTGTDNAGSAADVALYVLLSQSAGYDFKNKLVKETDVAATLKFVEDSTA